jgi:hypothetical protein
MIKKLVYATAIGAAMALAATASAYADECADTMKSVEQALEEPAVNEDAKKQAGDLLAKAKEKQAAGDSKSCVTFLTEATKVLTAQ